MGARSAGKRVRIPPATLRTHRGPHWFGNAYAKMMAHDPHAPGSVDRIPLERMVGLSRETAPFLYPVGARATAPYRRGSRPRLEELVRRWVPGARDPEEVIHSVIEFTSGLGGGENGDLAQLRFGGREEEIIDRGSDWCSDVARVAAALLQVSGLPARMVMLADVRRAYSGHTIVEVQQSGVWGAVDPLTGVTYRGRAGAPVSTWTLIRTPELIDRAQRLAPNPYSYPSLFRKAAVAEYALGRRSAWNYRVSSVSAYYERVLNMAEQGWPGGLRWLEGEDSSSKRRSRLLMPR